MRRPSFRLSDDRDRNRVFGVIWAAGKNRGPGVRLCDLCQETGLSKRQVAAALQALRKQGDIVCDPRPYWRLL